MTVIDALVAIWDEPTRKLFGKDPELVQVQKFFGDDRGFGHDSVESLLEGMDDAGIDGALVCGTLTGSRFDSDDAPFDLPMQAAHQCPSRLRAGLMIDPVRSIRRTCAAIERAAADPLVAAIKVTPMMSDEPVASRVFYPIYERCEGLGLPVTINVGVPGPRYRARLQDPLDLDDVCIDFPDLTVIAAHMGHPWESLVIRLMMKYENLYLSNSAYLSRYMDPAIVSFMDSSRGRDKLVFASDEPMIPMARALEDARALEISEEAMDNFLGNNALRTLRWSSV